MSKVLFRVEIFSTKNAFWAFWVTTELLGYILWDFGLTSKGFNFIHSNIERVTKQK